jgi:polysaccharide biosynthesis/export protein
MNYPSVNPLLRLAVVSGVMMNGVLLAPAAIAQTAPSYAAQPPSRIPNQPMPYMGGGSDTNYLLGSGDIIKVEFYNVPEFSGELMVLPNGTVNVTNIGTVNVQGMTLVQAANAITVKARATLKRPITTVNLINPRPIAVSIAGEVNRPGSYNLAAVGTKSAVGLESAIPSLTRTLQLAEGVTQMADLSQVLVRRQRPGASGVIDTYSVNLRQMLETGDNRQDVRLQDGDSIYIPPINEVSIKDARLVASASFATKKDKPLQVVVAGQVNRPGSYTLAEYSNGAVNSGIASGDLGQTSISRTPSITQAVQIAGGITQTADVRNIEVRRLTKAGETKTVKVNFWNLLTNGDIQQDLPLQDGDTIVIPTATAMSESEITALASTNFSPDNISVNVVGQAEKPGIVKVPPNTPMNQAILAAGGFNREAKKKRVSLVRLNPNGSVTKREISVNFEQGINEQNNPPLRNNDTIVIERTGLAGVGKTLGALASPFSTLFSVFRLFGL